MVNLKQLSVVWAKEWLDGIRDRRALAAAMLTSLAGPLLIGLALANQAKTNEETTPLELGLEGRGAPALAAYLESRGAELSTVPSGAEVAVREGEKAVVLRIGADYAEEFRAGRAAGVELLYDSSRASGRRAVARIERLLEDYSREVSALRLTARGVSPELSRPLAVGKLDFAAPRARAASLLLMLSMFLLMTAFAASMNLAIDSTAGERERGSLEALLLHPVEEGALAAGKWLAGVALAAAGVVVALGVSSWVLGWRQLEGLGFAVALGGRELGLALLVLLPLALLAPALQMLVALFSQSYKEAQTYLSLLLFAPTLPGFYFTFTAHEPEPWMRWLPFLGQQIALSEALRGEVAWAALAGLAVATALVSLACVQATGRLLHHERIVFGR